MFRTWNCPQRLIAAAVRMPPMALLNEFLKNFFNGNTTFLDLTGLARLESGNGKEYRREFVEAYHGLFPWNILLFLKYSKFENQTPKQLRHIEAELFWGLLISKIAAEEHYLSVAYA